MPCTAVTNFCSEGKVMLLLSMVRYQVLLCFRHIRYGRYCYKQAMYVKLQVFTMYLAISQQQNYQGFFKYGVYFFETLVRKRENVSHVLCVLDLMVTYFTHLNYCLAVRRKFC